MHIISVVSPNDTITQLSYEQDYSLLQQFLVSHTPSTLMDKPILSISHYINAKNLACPLPLLKLKMALKSTQANETIYLTATDPNSTQDIGAFCQHLGHTLWTAQTDSDLATIFHLLITKNS